MRHAKKAASAVLSAVLILLQPAVLGDMTVYAANEDTDIGCYEYGSLSSTPYSPPSDDYNPQLYGENARSVYYVSPDGSDTDGDGSSGSPWATIGYAALQVTAAGSVIRLTAGSWTVNERVFLAPGVSLEGAGAAGDSVSTVTSTALAYRPDNVDNAIINFVSDSVVNGAQHISAIRFDGGNRTASQAIEICGRDNVSVHDCVFVDFECMAVGWRTCAWKNIPDVTAPDSIPSQWVRGGRFYNNTVTNCARYDSYARGALFCGGLEGFRIYKNVMTESNIVGSGGAIETVRGVPIKFWYYDGWMLDCKIYGNTIHKLNSAISGNDRNGWPFAIESICHYGMEICGNDIIGAIDLNFSMSGAYDGFKGHRADEDVNATVYDYATWIHDNNVHAQGEEGWSQNAVILEYDTERTIIERNIITDCASVLYFTPRGACAISDVVFRYNQCTDIRFRNSSDADAVRIDGWDDGFSVSNLSIHNNLLLCDDRGGFGIKLAHYGPYTGSSINISNNIISGFQWNPLVVQLHDQIDGLTIQNNLFYGNGGWNGVDGSSTTGNITEESKITDYVNSGNVELDAAQWSGLFVDAAGGDYHLKEGSAAIDAGVDFGAGRDLDGNSVPYGGSTMTSLDAPTGLAWSDMTAGWDAVSGAVGYSVQLYRNDTACGAIVSESSTTHDFSLDIAAAGEGDYTFRVTALGDGTLHDDGAASNASPAFSYTPASLPAFTVQPTPCSVSAGSSAEFSASATGDPAPSYQWQRSTDGGATYTDVEGATSGTLTLSAVAAADNGLLFRCVAKNGVDGGVTSNAALLTVTAQTPGEYTLTFDANGGSSISSVTLAGDSTIDLADYTPTREGYDFAGWYSDEDLTQPITSVQLTENTTIYAGWQENNDDPDPGTVDTFTDVSEDDWFFDDVMFVYQQGLMIGVDEALFDPNGETTRAMTTTTIWRMEGKKAPESGGPLFTDVTSGQWYTEAILWANENGIVAGYGDGLFGTHDPVTREQIAAILYRYADHKGYDTEITGSISRFTDKDVVSEWAIHAMEWAVGSGLIVGEPGDVLDPQGNATRAEFAAMLQRFMDMY